MEKKINQVEQDMEEQNIDEPNMNEQDMDEPNMDEQDIDEQDAEEQETEKKEVTLRRPLIILAALLLILLLLLLIRSCGKRDNEVPVTPKVELSDLTPRDTFFFGVYEQDNDLSNGKEPIEWIVLSKENGEVFATSKYLIENMPYNDENVGTTWETCTLRKWLNEDFLNEAFTDEERSRLKAQYLINGDNVKNGLDGGNDTVDRIFLLSYDDVVNPAYGFSGDYTEDDINRLSWLSAYALSKNPYHTDLDTVTSAIWWIRMPGIVNTEVGGVNGYGRVDQTFSNTAPLGVRPAICLHMSGNAPEITPTPTPARETPDFSELNKGDVFTFGEYDRDNNLGNGKEPVDWIVLGVDSGELLALALHPLDARKYNDAYAEITWADCSLRAWLNDEFLHETFSEDEISIIINKELKNNDNPVYGTAGGSDTQDRVFLLSVDDVLNPEYGFSSDPAEQDAGRTCQATYHANMAAKWSPAATDSWILRSPGIDGLTIVSVTDMGDIAFDGITAAGHKEYIRPAIWIKIGK